MIAQNFKNNPREYLLADVQLFAHGLVVFIFVIIAFLIFLKMVHTYYKHKLKQHLIAGISYFGLSMLWMAVGLRWLTILLFNMTPNEIVYLFLVGASPTITTTLWMINSISISNLKVKIQKILMSIIGITGIIVEITFLYFLFKNWRLLGDFTTSPLYMAYTPIFELYLAGQLLAFIIPGYWLSIKLIKINDATNKLKGKLLFTSFTLFTGGCLFQIFTPVIILYLIGQIAISISAITFYYGFSPPKWIEKRLLKE